MEESHRFGVTGRHPKIGDWCIGDWCETVGGQGVDYFQWGSKPPVSAVGTMGINQRKVALC